MIYTLGHSTRTLEQFLELLGAHQIGRIVDVRRYPVSRRYPQFSQAALEAALAANAVRYAHEPELGGRRSPVPDSPNTAWRNAQFRGYADYMQTQEFGAALARLIDLDAGAKTAIMCAEAVPWRCHRQLIADALVAHGIDVEHVLAAGSTRRHVLSPHARIAPDGRVAYPGPD